MYMKLRYEKVSLPRQEQFQDFPKQPYQRQAMVSLLLLFLKREMLKYAD